MVSYFLTYRIGFRSSCLYSKLDDLQLQIYCPQHFKNNWFTNVSPTFQGTYWVFGTHRPEKNIVEVAGALTNCSMIWKQQDICEWTTGPSLQNTVCLGHSRPRSESVTVSGWWCIMPICWEIRRNIEATSFEFSFRTDFSVSMSSLSPLVYLMCSGP